MRDVQLDDLPGYDLLKGAPDPYSRYNALLRQLSSFVRALERRQRRMARTQGT